MPARELMSWEPNRRRWSKFVTGHPRFVISCRQLSQHFNTNIPQTKEGSYQWANRWWKETAASLALPTADEPHPHAEVLARLGRHIDWARRHAPEEAAILSKHFRQVEKLGEDEEPDLDPLESEAIAKKREVAGLFGIHIPDDLHPIALSHFLGLDPIRHDRLARDKEAKIVPFDRTMGNLIQSYLDTQLARHRAGDASVGEFSNCRAGLFYFRDWIGSEQGVEVINAAKWNGYYLHLIGPDAPKSINTRRKHFRYARTFITWLDDLEIHPKPKNLDRRQYRFKGGGKEIRIMTVKTVTDLINAATGQLRLHLLLMLNCAFTQQDISDLHPSEVDWIGGRIRRKRSKTEEHDQVPVVDYPLWPETLSLLRWYFTSGDPNQVLLTESGKTWIRDKVKADGTRSRTDAIQSNYRKLIVEGKLPLKVFRKVGSTTINSSSVHGKYAIFFLGHAPDDVAHKHYLFENGPGFDSAVKWLGEQFGF